MSELLLAVLVGLAVGVVVGALGAGGGILSVPVLVCLLGQEAHAASASSLVIVGATAAVSLPHHARNGNVEWCRGALFGSLSVVGSVVGSRLSAAVSDKLLMGLFATLLTAVGLVMASKGLRERHTESLAEAPPRRRRGWAAVVAAATASGLLTGFFGVGGGFIVVPMLTMVLALPIRAASGTSLLIMVVASVSGLLARVGTGVEIGWPLTLLFAAGSMAGGVAGGPLSARARPWLLTTVLAALLLAVAAFTLVETFILT